MLGFASCSGSCTPAAKHCPRAPRQSPVDPQSTGSAACRCQPPNLWEDTEESDYGDKVLFSSLHFITGARAQAQCFSSTLNHWDHFQWPVCWYRAGRAVSQLLLAEPPARRQYHSKGKARKGSEGLPVVSSGHIFFCSPAPLLPNPLCQEFTPAMGTSPPASWAT